MQISPVGLSSVRPQPARASVAASSSVDQVTLGGQETGLLIPRRQAPPASPPAYPGQGQIFFANGGSSEVPVELRDLVQKPRGTELPLGSIPSQRWTVTPEIEAFHVQDAATTSLEQANNQEMEHFFKPILEARYGNRSNLTAVELGPAMTTGVAQTLHGQNDRYLAVDLSVPYLARQEEFLHQLGPTAHTYAARGDTYDLPVVSGGADLVVTSCHPPFFSASPADKMLAIDEVARALKPGGEFVLFPYYQDQQPAEVTEHLLSRFELVQSIGVPQEEGRDLLILKKRA